MLDNAHARVHHEQTGGRRVLIVNTRAEARALASRVETTLLASGYQVQVLAAPNPNASTNLQFGVSGRETSPLRRLKALLLKSSLLRAVGLAWRLVIDRNKLSALMAKSKPWAIVLFDDRPLTPNYLLRKLAAVSNIPVVLVPFAVSTIEADVKTRERKAVHRLDQSPGRMLKRLIARRWPDQVHVSSGGAFLFHNVWDTLAVMACGTLPQNPWYVGGSRPELVCVGGEDQRDYFLRAGVPAERIVLTGLPSLDELAWTRDCIDATRRKLVAKYRLAAERRLVICAVPQYAEHGLLDWDSHNKLTEELLSTLAGSGASVLLSLHPKSQRSSYESRAATHGLPIMDEPLADVLAVADLLVATFSSTVGWAVGLGIPAFVAATIHADYQLYRDMPGVVVVEDHAALAGELSRFVGDQNFRAELSEATRRATDRIGRLDGRAGERVASAIDQLIGWRVAMTGKPNA